MATKKKADKKVEAPKKEKTKAEIIEDEIYDLDEEQNNLPSFDDFYFDCETIENINSMIKSVPKEHKLYKTGIDTTAFVQKAKALLDEINNIDKKILVQDKASNNQYKALQKKIDSKKKLLQKERGKSVVMSSSSSFTH
jgi:hypothetical protein